MIDNEVFENKVRSYYKSDIALLNAYKETGKFKYVLKTETYVISDEMEATISAAKQKLRPVMELILPILKELHNREEKDFDYYLAIELMKSRHRTVFKEIEVLGLEEIAALNFDYKLVLQKIAQLKKHAENFPIITELSKYFKVGKSYTSTYIKIKLEAIFKKMKRADLKPSIQTLKKFFKLRPERTRVGANKGTKYLIEQALHKVD
ncbi:MAG: hypothetical protein EOO90_21460 [Pedobacter sp.]|nr:MAG: hypothetical protein EOO90_21460 [Pedobacter sp.]